MTQAQTPTLTQTHLHLENGTGELRSPLRLALGTILTLRMRGHSRTNGQEYFAPAIVLQQFQPGGEIAAIIMDDTSGVSINPCYAIRDLTTVGDGGQRRLVELQSNIGEILFDPNQQRDLFFSVSELQGIYSRQIDTIRALESRVKMLEELLTSDPKKK